MVDDAVLDLSRRWKRARRAALARVVVGPVDEATPEPDLVRAAAAVDHELALRAVFESGYVLGQGFRRFYRAAPSVAELPSILDAMAVPCLAGGWSEPGRRGERRLERGGCAEGRCDGRLCSHHREATLGLVQGLTGGVGYARHESRGHGDARCVDVLFADPSSDLRFAPIPEDMRASLEEVRRLATKFDSRADVEFLGVAERALYYRARRPDGDGAVSVGSTVARAVRRRFPEYTAVDASSRAVLSST